MPTESSPANRRKHPRVHAPKGMKVAWRSGTLQGVSRMGTVAIGGLFLHTPNPPSNGATLELLFDIAVGAEVRARAVVRNCMPGKGMGVKFVNMRAEDRSRLNNFLKAQLAAGNIQEDFPPAQSKPPVAEPVPAAPHSDSAAGTQDPSAESRTDGVTMPEIRQEPDPPTAADVQPETISSANEIKFADTGNTSSDQAFTSEKELKYYLELSEKGTYYQLLDVATDSDRPAIKQAFYVLARKFHPDRHMGKPEWVAPLQQLMGAVTEAYNVLNDDKKRELYDKKLTLSRNRTETEESIDDCLKFAAACQRDNNMEGSIVWLRKCVKLAPDVAKHRVSLAASLGFVSHHRREAIEHFQKAIELDPWNTGAYLQFGELYEAMNLPWRAEPLYAKILEYDPGHQLARKRLAKVANNEKKKSGSRMAGIFSKK